MTRVVRATQNPEVMDFPPGMIGIASGFLGRYREFDRAMAALRVPMNTEIGWKLGVNIAYNYNEMIRTMRPDAEWIWFMGDDHLFEPDILIKLLKHDVDVVFPLCLRRQAPFHPVIHTSAKEGYRRMDLDFLQGKSGLIDISDYDLGNAGMLVKRHVFDAIPAPWYEDGRAHPETGGSDLYVCEKIRAAGFKMWLDMDTALGHICHMCVWPEQKLNGEWGARLRDAIDLEPIECDMHEEFTKDASAVRDWGKWFNEWREKYDETTYEEHCEIADELYENFPMSTQFNKNYLLQLFAPATDAPEMRVLEFGGGIGTLAQDIFKTGADHIAAWHNLEISRKAVENTICQDERYSAEVLDDWPWEVFDGWDNYNMLILSHIAEHIRGDQLKTLLEKAKDIDIVYLDVPVAEKTSDINWDKYLGTHILEIGWDQIDAILYTHGYQEMYRQGLAGTIRLYGKSDTSKGVREDG